MLLSVVFTLALSGGQAILPVHAEQFVAHAETRLGELALAVNRASWVANTYITVDTQAIAADANEAFIAEAVRLAKEAGRFDGVAVPQELRRKLQLLRTILPAPAPSDPEKTAEVARLAAKLEAAYGEAKACDAAGKCRDIQEITRVFTSSRDPKELLAAWTAWHAIGRPMRGDYERFAALMNEGARELGYADTGALWRSTYDMTPAQLASEVDRLWAQAKPLYDALHCHVRAKLAEKYGRSTVDPRQPIPAHLLGNIWAQDWSNVYDLVAPGNASAGYDLTKIIEQKQLGPKEMVRIGEGFFTSLGFDPLPQTFWERSMLTKPRDREVVCHASASDVDDKDDLRIKMCIEPTAEDFKVIHHELGHNFYQRAYKNQTFLHRDSAHDGFHEAIGDTIALSVTPAYLRQLGLLDASSPEPDEVATLLRDALEHVAFIPFGIVVDRWRWQVFSGETKPADYNKAWWELRGRYQGVAAPVARTETDFDPGAKFHIPGNTSYTRYFLARFLEFQLHRDLCRIAGNTGPLHRCTIYGNAEAGAHLRAFLEAGRSRPWPDTLETLGGGREMDATAMLDYFAPLKKWLDEQNKGRQCGW